jgi:site-specific recombinase XerD
MSGSFPISPGCVIRRNSGPTRAHVIAWRKHFESRELAPSSIRRKLSALSALFDYLCEHNAVAGNPVDGVKRPIADGNGLLTASEIMERYRSLGSRTNGA